ncbi:glyoxylase-like metal-dependent hydrolase (beta-lactamase superfamily II) [Neorhizobium sp. R1-B]|jgi:glyoxylase-like metal-dependent hydrolase (beta-lactamase superfamily II)|uniref:MBL fold metallo-hydrolase n=1 Tax=unclassified Neorhizobium TaxID=2629175 RepID=UPI001048DB56|nr:MULTISPECIES: MBL fold metallo-hydrolase [unclassified Neorhizobium]TCV76192.1 glyoxylase-like metal-dependent hydrolase (beta-lactamase superfamily II) [Neorhizobium sp. S3-V5DH]TDX88820.1 glyoxylase-like metal-dependent hydrolase (beta-lactamase superfamily II) [Neorhizobium sp. R1-B]
MTSIKIDRRTLLGTAGLGIIASPAIISGRALAQESKPQAIDRVTPPDIHKFKVGGFQVLVVKDGARPSANPQEIFGTNQSAEAVGTLLNDNFLPADKFVNSFSPTLVDTGSEVILFDTGLGKAARAQGGGRLIEGLAAAGYMPEDISIVVITHMHGDHIGGIMEDGKPAFPKARYVAGETEYNFWSDAARAGTPTEGNHKAVLANVKPHAEKMTFLKDGGDVVSGITAMMAPGHTPGHLVFNIESEGKRLVLTADTANHYILSLERPEWEVRFDMDKAQAAATRKKVYDMIATDKVAFLGYHMPFPAVGFVERQETGYRFVPKSYQFDI